jgi:hypothetical protein
VIIDNWRSAWRMVSVQCMTAAGLLQGLYEALQDGWLSLPAEVQQLVLQSVPAKTVHYVTALLMLVGVVGRLIKQPKLHATEGPQP